MRSDWAPYPAPLRRPWGFTLMELAVVLVILGIALSVSLPFLVLDGRPEPRAAAELVARLHQARARAAREGGVVTVTVNLHHGEVRSSLRRARGRADSAVDHGTIAGWSRSQLSRRGADSLLVVHFDPLGRAVSLPLEWQDRNGRVWRLVVDPWTGESSVAHR
jgi:prepilin-type N-terminal cleavage/methylation domain-containing protein